MGYHLADRNCFLRAEAHTQPARVLTAQHQQRAAHEQRSVNSTKCVNSEALTKKRYLRPMLLQQHTNVSFGNVMPLDGIRARWCRMQA